jgi:hypothetical protein
MTQVQTIGSAADRVMTALVAGLEIEFGRGAGEALAQRFLEAEECDFLWDARGQERWLGTFIGGEIDDDIELDRIAIMGRLDGKWFAATVIVDGDSNPHGLMGRCSFEAETQAAAAFASAH